MEEEKKYCCNCKYVSTPYNEEPCKSCRARSNWQSNVKFKTGDIVVSKNDPYKRNLYIYLRNKWVLRIPNYVTVVSSYIISTTGYRGSEIIDKLIRNSNAECEWLDDLEYASPEMIKEHDDTAKTAFDFMTFSEWFSELISEEPEKIDETFTLPKRSTTDPKTTYKYKKVKDFCHVQKNLRKRYFPNPESLSFRFDKFPTLNGNFIKNVIFSDPATIIFWEDGTKTVVKTQDGEKYDKEKGFAMAVCKKVFGNERDYYNVFKRWMRKGKEV